MKRFLVGLTIVLTMALVACDGDTPYKEEQEPEVTTEEYHTLTCYINGIKHEYEYYHDAIYKITLSDTVYRRVNNTVPRFIVTQENTWKEMNPGLNFFEILDPRVEESISDHTTACELDIEVVDLRE